MSLCGCKLKNKAVDVEETYGPVLTLCPCGCCECSPGCKLEDKAVSVEENSEVQDHQREPCARGDAASEHTARRVCGGAG